MHTSLQQSDKGNDFADDTLIGGAAIAEFLFGDAGKRRKVFYLARLSGRARLPTFKMGNTICARKSVLLAWVKAQESGEGWPRGR